MPEVGDIIKVQGAVNGWVLVLDVQGSQLIVETSDGNLHTLEATCASASHTCASNLILATPGVPRPGLRSHLYSQRRLTCDIYFCVCY